MVSVCMGTKNGATFIREQLLSILPQLSRNDEVVISDDCSSDDTLAIIRSLKDPRVRILESATERGVTKNFEASLRACHGDFIFLGDQDDVWLPGKIQLMKNALMDYDLVICDCKLVDDSLRTQNHSFYNVNRSGPGFFRNIIKNSYMGCCMAFTRKLRDRALPIPKDVPIHDFWIGLVAELYFRVCFLPDVLVLHRRHGSNASTTGNSSRQSMNQKILNRYRIVKNLFIHKYYAG
jgi:glycosyltransferase involved in cell wall biosynthesis